MLFVCFLLFLPACLLAGCAGRATPQPAQAEDLMEQYRVWLDEGAAFDPLIDGYTAGIYYVDYCDAESRFAMVTSQPDGGGYLYELPLRDFLPESAAGRAVAAQDLRPEMCIRDRGGMDTCDEGSIYLDGQEVSAYNQKQLTQYRRYDVGFVFQFYNLVQNLTALENVELASEICKDPLPAEAALRGVGLAERMGNFPAQLSGGEQQRVSIARALAKNPKILLCDEPTGALDYNTGKQVLKLLQDTCRKTGRTVIVITHNSALTAMADRVIRIKSGQVAGMEQNPPVSYTHLDVYKRQL